eukprot:UN13217
MAGFSTKKDVDSTKKTAQNKEPLQQNLKEMSLKAALKNEKILEMFMQHLSKEFSLEIILSLIEFSQFKMKLYDFAVSVNYFECDEDNVPLDPEWKIQFDYFISLHSIPQSSIVYDDLSENEVELYSDIEDVIQRNEMEFLIRTRKLYEKYIKGYEFELNLSFQQRNILTTKMSEFDERNQHVQID